ncbi:MAG TPA: hypothetical protein VJJ48_00080 [Candidatus Paceibacterota bacterium]
MPEIVPAILPKSSLDLENQIGALPSEINFFHLDVLENDIWAPTVREFEAHLMMREPAKVLDRWIDRGARRIITHQVGEGILKYRKKVEIGLGFELDVPVEDVLAMASFSDFVHIMSIAEIGAQGHPLDPRVFDRIRAVQEKFPALPISVDGGITKENYQKLIEAGADRLVVGSHFQDIWNIWKK